MVWTALIGGVRVLGRGWDGTHERSRKDARKLSVESRELCRARCERARRYAATTIVLTVAVTSSATSTTTMYVPV